MAAMRLIFLCFGKCIRKISAFFPPQTQGYRAIGPRRLHGNMTMLDTCNEHNWHPKTFWKLACMSRNSEQWQSSRAGKRSKLILMATSLSLLFFSLMAPSVFAESLESDLSRLETKFFQHDFPKDETNDRLNRLEQLMFGEAKTGSVDDRVKGLLALVPNLNPKTDDAAKPAVNESPADAPPLASTPKRTAPAPLAKAPAPSYADEDPPADTNSYPAVTAIEKKLLGRDFVGESLGKRLDRLEIKAFGKTSASDDLQDRVDRLRSSSGIDIAKAKPANSEWADEEEDSMIAGAGDVQPFTGIGGDDPSSSRAIRKQLTDSYGRPTQGSYDPYAGSGTFGAGGAVPPRANNYNSGTYGSGTGLGAYNGSGMPPSAPAFARGSAPAPAPALGVSQQISMLEKEVFKKTYSNETLLSRLNRLETTVFPQDKSQGEKSLPERVSRLVSAVPLSQASAEPPVAPARRPRKDPDFPDLDFPGPGSISSKPGGLSKIINGLGNALQGGYTSGYSTTPGTLVSDPQTGLLFDQYTGTLIDPQTGAVVGRRSVQMGGNPMGGFNSGFSPMSPFGGMGGSGMQFGFGGSGMRFGGWP